jgi:hypothetical protein
MVVRVHPLQQKVNWDGVQLLTVERAVVYNRLEMPVVKADVHAPIFCFPTIFKL